MKSKKLKNKKNLIKDKIIYEDINFIHSKCSKLAYSLSNKSLLLTGANGILGQYLLHTLYKFNEALSQPCKIYAYINKNISKDSDIYYLKKNKNFFFIKKDLTNKFLIKKNIDYIIHAASPADPKKYLNNQITTLRINTETTRKFLEYCVDKKTKFLFVSSGEIYGSPSIKSFPTKEDFISKRDHLSSRSCYTESKIFGETLCKVYKEIKNVNSIIARPIYVVGPGFKNDDSRAWTHFIREAVKGKDLIIHSSGKNLRGVCYIADAIIQMFYILIYGKKGEVFNVGNSEFISIKKLAQIICKIKDNKIKYTILDKKNLSKAPMRNAPDMTKTFKKFNIKNYYDSSNALKRTLIWAENKNN